MNMEYKINSWSDISDRFHRGAILLGNGSSVAVDSRFNYPSILDYSRKRGIISREVETLFEHFKTDDFELVLRLLFHASTINDALSVEDVRTRVAYESLRDCLIRTVRDIHPERYEISDKIPVIYEFVKKFDTVVSLNYDIIIYWVAMYGKDQSDSYSLKDCFTRPGDNNELCFFEDWQYMRKPYYDGENTTLIFYPHGNLIFSRISTGLEYKLKSSESNLLSSILDKWKSDECTPLFVSEGTQHHKYEAVGKSRYLHTVYKEVLPKLGRSLVIYGWGFGEQDEYILERMKVGGEIEQVAVSVYGSDQDYCDRVNKLISRVLGCHVKIEFFDSNSPGVWCNTPRKRIYRSMQQAIRKGLTFKERWRAEDRGLIKCWEAGRELAKRDPSIALSATNNEAR